MNRKYNIIYADPPWSYRAWSSKGKGRSAESHYPTMSIEDIKALLKIPLYGMGSGRAIQDVYREDYVDPVRSVTREYEMPIA